VGTTDSDRVFTREKRGIRSAEHIAIEGDLASGLRLEMKAEVVTIRVMHEVSAHLELTPKTPR